MSEVIDVANTVVIWSLKKRRTAYAGSAVRVERLSDNAEMDIGFVAGEFDAATYETFISGTTGRIKTWYDQKGSADHTQATATLRPPLVKGYNNVYATRTSGGPFLAYDSALGTYTNITISVVWQAPLTKPAGFSTHQCAMDIGSDLEFVTNWWTSDQSAYSRNGGGGVSSWATTDDGAPRHNIFSWASNQLTMYEFDALSSPTTAQTNPTLNRVRIGKNAFGPADANFYEVIIYSSIPNASDVAADTIANYPGLFTYDDIYLAVGDSMTTAGFCGIGNLWTRWAFRRLEAPRWFVQGQGATTIVDWQGRVTSTINKYLALPRTGSAKVVIFLGTNDIFFGATGATAAANLRALATTLSGAGWEVYVSTILARFASPPFATEAVLFNSDIKADGTNLFAGVVDTTTNALLTEITDPEFYVVDQTHLGPSGQREYSVPVSNALQGFTLGGGGDDGGGGGDDGPRRQCFNSNTYKFR